MNGVITEKDYPIQARWILKTFIRSFFGFLLVLPLPLLYLYYSYKSFEFKSSMLIVLIVFVQYPITFIALVLRRKFFHYSIEEKFLTLRQGILSKQERHIPYGVIQNLLVKQGLLDRLFGIASLSIENASQGGGVGLVPPETKIFGMKVVNKRYKRPETIGFMGNRVDIPGLNKADAEALKSIVMKKMKASPVEDSQSGL